MGNKMIREKERSMPPTKGRAGIRGFSWDIYIVAFVLTLTIFGLGVWMGQALIRLEVNNLQTTVLDLSADASLLQTAISIMSLDNNTSASCRDIVGIENDLETSIRKIGRRLTQIESKGGTDPTLKSEYMTLEYRNYLMNELIKHRCNTSTNTILYFYSNDKNKCPSCRHVGYVLSELVKESGEQLRIYSFDVDITSSTTKMLKNKYNISKYPTVVVSRSGGQNRQKLETEDKILKYTNNVTGMQTK